MLLSIANAVLNMSLTASIAILVVVVLRRLLRHAPKVLSFALWGIVLFRLLCPISLPFRFSLFGLLDVPLHTTGGFASSMQYLPEQPLQIENPDISPALPDSVAGSETPAVSGSEVLPAVLPVLWLGGVAGMGVYAAVSCRRLRKKLAAAAPLRDNVFLADEIGSPFVLGVVHPRIYLPSSMDERQQRFVLAHEQHHIRRGDPAIKLLAFAALCLHWFNPLVWLAFVLASRDMEMSCDEAVVRQLGDDVRADYAAALLSFAAGRQIAAGVPTAFGENDPAGRIRNLAFWKKPALPLISAAVLLLVVLGAALLTNPPVRINAPLEAFLDATILDHHRSDHSEGNFCCADWELLGSERDGDRVTVYLWVLYREYSGPDRIVSAAHIPTVITAEQTGESCTLIEYWEPRDGNRYLPSMEARFPKSLLRKALDSTRYHDRQSARLNRMAEQYFASHSGTPASPLTVWFSPLSGGDAQQETALPALSAGDRHDTDARPVLEISEPGTLCFSLEGDASSLTVSEELYRHSGDSVDSVVVDKNTFSIARSTDRLFFLEVSPENRAGDHASYFIQPNGQEEVFGLTVVFGGIIP